MRYRHREQYQAVMAKRRWLRSEGAYSRPDERGSSVAILVPFIEELVYDERDSRHNFERQTAELVELYVERKREPHTIMNASLRDFEEVLADQSVSSVVVAGFGSLSSVAVPFSKNRDADARYGHLDWLHLAGMATHLKLGEFVMYTCCGLRREFNPPLPVGVVSSHRNIRAPLGLGIFATGVGDNEALMRHITTVDELTYDDIKHEFPMERHRKAPLPDAAYVAARGMREWVNAYRLPETPAPEPIPHPDLRSYLE